MDKKNTTEELLKRKAEINKKLEEVAFKYEIAARIKTLDFSNPNREAEAEILFKKSQETLNAAKH